MKMQKENDFAYEEVIAGLYREYATDILRMCCLYLGNYQMAEDALQDTFVNVFCYYRKFQGNSNIKTWLTRVAINSCKKILAQTCSKKHLHMTGDEFAMLLEEETGGGGPGAYSAAEDRMILSRAIGRLEEKYREVIILFYYQELTTKEIAHVTGIPRTTVEFRLKKARAELKEDLKGVDFDEE
ncbi:MAG: sigma-70 family RNA polymerase sigma factor [Alistipes sp.]|nr:sigma-70 family RNA polymerase sigma factor [Alistipes sp.]